MKTFYSILGSFLLVGSVFAQGINPNNIKKTNEKILSIAEPTIMQANIELRASVECDGSYFYCENFEDVTAPNLPADMSSSSEENNYFVPFDGGTVDVGGFFTGNSTDAGVGGYWTYLDDHTQFAMTNDDSCLPNGAAPNENNNCDLSEEVLELPLMDFSQADSGMWIQFEYFHDKNWGGGDAFVEVSNDGGETWNALSEELPAQQEWQFAAFSLSDYYMDDSVKVRFTWSDNSSWASGLAIDDIIINPLPDRAARLNDQFHLLPSAYNGGAIYKTVPLDQASATGFSFGAVIQNMGFEDLDSARLYADIQSEGFSTQSYGLNTISLDYDTLYSNDEFTPTAQGQYDVAIYSEDDNMTMTETKTESFNISEYDYARDDFDFSGDYEGAYYINRGGDGLIGNVFDIYKETTLYAVKARIHPRTDSTSKATAVLRTVTGDFLDVLGSTDNPTGDPNATQFLYESQEVNIGQHSDGWINFVFNPPVTLNAGEVIFAGIKSLYTGTDTALIAYGGSADPATTIMQDINGSIFTDASAGEWFNFANAVFVRLNFDPTATAPVSISENKELNFNVYPNPNNGLFTVTPASNDAHFVQVQNYLGQIVFTENIKGQKQIDLSNLVKGVYSLSITNDSGLSSTQKVIIK
ncbi:MAG: T9SS type A sorting domain-containing protein [Flavobacteriales bacterium]